MGKVIPHFSIKNINKIDDYERFYHSKAYLKKKSGKLTFFKDEVDEIKKLAKDSGYTKFNKFVEHRKEWHEMKRKIPIKYLEAIGVKLDVLKFTIELDQKEFKEVLKIDFKPRYAAIKFHPIAYKTYEFPPDTSEKKAIEIMQEYAKKEERECIINYPDIKIIFIEPDARVHQIYFKPDINIDNEYVYPAKDGEGVGKVTLK